MSGRARVTLPIFLVALIVSVAFLGPACLNDAGSNDPDAHVTMDLGSSDRPPMPDLVNSNGDGGEDLAGHDLAKPILDFAATDLAGLVNCYNRAVCDPLTDFCITYNEGSAAVPGKTSKFSPACYSPDTPCADNGEMMDCNCIQNDGTLGLGCEGSCVDNGDGTYVCYAQ